MRYIDVLKEFLPKVFDEIKKDILNDEETKHFIDSEDTLKELIRKQEEILYKYLSEFPEAKETEKISKFYKELDIPYPVIIRNIELLKVKLLERVSLEAELNDKTFLLDLKKYINKLEDIISKEYIYKEIDKLKELENSPFNRYLLYSQHTSFIKQIAEAIKNNKLENYPLITADECIFKEYLSYPESVMVCVDANLCLYIDKLHELIHQISLTFYTFYSTGRYKEAYASLKEFIENSLKLSKTLAELYFTTFSNAETNFFNVVKYYQEANSKSYIAIIDIKNLKALNQIYSEEKVNKFLKDVEKRLTEFISNKREKAILIKGSTANFYLFLKEVSEETLRHIISQIKEIVETKFKVNGRYIESTVSIGVLDIDKSIDLSYLDITRLLLHIKDVAKESENKTYFVIDEEQKKKVQDWVNQRYKDTIFIQNSFKNKMVDVVFQPIFDTNNKEIAFLEGLARIKDDEGKLIPAGVFINLVYDLGLISYLDALVLEKLQQKKKLIQKVSNKLFLNLSFESLNSRDFLSLLKDFISCMNEFDITIEITEQKLVRYMQFLDEIKKEYPYVKFAIDDFGSGYSSLTTVAELLEKGGLQVLKIDGTLIKELPQRAFTQKIVKAISSMSKALNVKTVAEFVEDDKTLNMIKGLGIDFAQGYGLSKPKTIEELILEKVNLSTVNK